MKRLLFRIWHLAFQLSQGELLPSELSVTFQGCISILPLVCLYLLLLLCVHVLLFLTNAELCYSEGTLRNVF